MGSIAPFRRRFSVILRYLSVGTAGPRDGSDFCNRLLAGVVRGDTLESLTESTEALARQLAEGGDKPLEQDMFELVRAQAQEKWPGLDWDQCGNLAALVRLLKGDAMTWPEKWMTQMRPNWKEDVWTEVRTELEPAVKAQLRQELESTVKAELRLEVEAELRAELRPKVEQQLRDEIREAKHDQ